VAGRLNIFKPDFAAIGALDRLNTDFDGTFKLSITDLFQTFTPRNNPCEHLHIVEGFPDLVAWRINRRFASYFQTNLLSADELPIRDVDSYELCGNEPVTLSKAVKSGTCDAY
jgi:hypothetical protein